MNAKPENAHLHKINVTWGDCDPAKIAYTGRLPNFTLDAVNGWWEAHLDGDGWFQMELDHNIGTPFVRFEMDMSAPVTPRHTLDCYVWPERLGETSITFRVDGEQNGVLCFSARTISVFTKADEFRKQKPPARYREAVERSLSNPLQPPRD